MIRRFFEANQDSGGDAERGLRDQPASADAPERLRRCGTAIAARAIAREKGVEDVQWALVNKLEFIINY